MRRQSITCETCGAVVESLEAHLEKITARRRLYGDTWEITARMQYAPDADVVTTPLLAYTPGSYQDRDQDPDDE